MPTVKDDLVLEVEGILSRDPALGDIGDRAEALVAKRNWRTTSIRYHDHPTSDASEGGQAWSMCFSLGLDHVRDASPDVDWFSDVEALAQFASRVTEEECCRFNAELISHKTGFWAPVFDLDPDSNPEVNLELVRKILTHYTRRTPRSWWRRLLGLK